MSLFAWMDELRAIRHARRAEFEAIRRQALTDVVQRVANDFAQRRGLPPPKVSFEKETP